MLTESKGGSFGIGGAGCGLGLGLDHWRVLSGMPCVNKHDQGLLRSPRWPCGVDFAFRTTGQTRGMEQVWDGGLGRRLGMAAWDDAAWDGGLLTTMIASRRRLGAAALDDSEVMPRSVMPSSMTPMLPSSHSKLRSPENCMLWDCRSVLTQ